MASQFTLEDCIVPRRSTKCWDCEKACGGCSWSRSFEPVPGWTAQKTEVKSATCNSGKMCSYLMPSYHVIDCPQFVRTPDRKTDNTELTDEQFRRMNRLEQDGRANNGRKY